MTNLENDLQNNSTKLNEEKGPKDTKPAAKSRPFERPSLVNLNHSSKMYEESGSENENIEEDKKGENEKNTKESTYTSIGTMREESKPSSRKLKNPRIIMKSQEMKGKLRKLLSPGKRPFPIWERTFL